MHSEQHDLMTLRELNSKFIHNFVTNDVAAHNAIIHPEFRTVTSLGGHMDRVAYLVEWATGFDPDVIPYWDMRNERITLFDDVALVTATTKYVRVRGGVETVGMTCYTDTYLRTDGLWLCVLAQLTPVARENYPSDDTIVVRYIRGQLQL
jgi:hypothetical protein